MKKVLTGSKKALAVILSLSIISCAFCITGFAADVDYTIANPYSSVNWDTYSQYKADLHSHTTASDGNNSLKEMTEAHYAHGFDIVAVTDHGVVDYGWTSQQVIPAMKVVLKLVKDKPINMESLNAQGGTAQNGNSYSLVSANGSDYYYQTDASGVDGAMMMRVPFGIENNPTSLNNAHVNSWFVDYGNGIMGGTSDYVTPISNVDALGGLSVINHPGEYTNARDEVYTEDAYNIKNISYKYDINKFAGLLTEYESCIGIDVNSKGDNRTRFDRKLWDILLERVVPTGRNVLGIATSDAHSTDVVYTGYTMVCMESLTSDNLKTSLSEGAFFAASKNLGNYDEIAQIAAMLAESDSAEAVAFAPTMTALAERIAAELENGSQDSKYSAPFDVDAPEVTDVIVDNDADSVTLKTTDDALLVRWIADGKTIATGNTLVLDNYSEEIGSYVRAEIFGEGGIVYSQPFMLSYEGAPAAQSNDYVDLWLFASIIPDTLVRLLASLSLFAKIWQNMVSA